MFTSRAEYRLLLREDNADLRLSEQAHSLGLLTAEHWQTFQTKRTAITAEQQRLKNTLFYTDNAEVNALLEQALRREVRALELLARPNIRYQDLCQIEALKPGVSDPKVAEQVEIQAKYQGYIERQQADIERNLRQEQTPLAPDIDYKQVSGLSNEVRQKLNQHKPENLGQAARIAGITPAAISLLRIHLKKYNARLQKN